VELSEIEAVLQQQPGIQAAGVKVTHTDQGMELAAFAVADAGVTLDAATIADELRRVLPEYMVPKYLDVVAELPLSNSGKIDRNALPEPGTLLKRARGQGEPPADEIERRVVEIWEKALGVSDISVTDDFFTDLGGHSLLAARTITALRASLDEASVSVRDLYRYPSVRALSAELRSRGVTGGGELQADSGEAPTPSEVAFASVGRLTRTTVSWLQGLSVLVFYSLVSAPIAFSVLMMAAVVDGRIAWADAMSISTIVGFGYWPALVTLTIVLKWTVIGRYKPGKYPVWGFYYFRWWLVTRFQALSWSEMLSGTPLMSLYYRAMGAKVGRGVTLTTPHCLAFDVISVGDDSSIGTETQLLGCRVEDGMLVIAPVTIGRDCFVGMHCNLGLDTAMGDGARLEDMSALADGAALAAGEMGRGVPAQPAYVRAPGDQLKKTPRGRVRRFVFGVLHLGLIYAMGYFLLATITPAVALIFAALYFGGPVWAAVAAMASVPLSVGCYLAGVIVVKRYVIGRLEVGLVKQYSVAYLRHWFSNYLMENTRQILMPLYATVYLPGFLRKLGAKIGHGSEISTVAHICPDHLEVGDGSFLADACLVGGHRIHAGYMQTGPVSIGSKSFIGNSALVPGGSIVGDEVLIGVASTPPVGTKVPDRTAWLGAPSFALPQRQQDCCFPEATTFSPTASMRRQRAAIDAARVIGPGLIVMANLVLLATALVVAWHNLPLWGVLLAIPAIDAALSFNAILIVALIKKACLGTLQPTVRPLWSRFVWLNEFVNALYEGVVATVMTPLLGTRMAAPALRMMGCKVGSWVFLDTTLFSEFDLVQIDDHAALNLGATVQTHLFEDRVFKADMLRIGTGCSVANMAVVLYDTQMHAGAQLRPLSVLMKGESLPPGTVWSGIPCEQIDMRPRKLNAGPVHEQTAILIHVPLQEAA
ncbi:MAG: Pls/PosA family non-ribosomal peptide synthetase, partial [Hyphomicrobium sp.]